MTKISTKNARPIDVRLRHVGFKLPKYMLDVLNTTAADQKCTITLLLYNIMHALATGDLLVEVPPELQNIRITEKKLVDSMDMFKIDLYTSNGTLINPSNIEE